MDTKDRAAEALRLAEQLDSLVIIDEVGSNNPLAKESAAMLREYAALLQAQPAEAGVVHVCPARDIECGSNPASWCKSCPKQPAEAGRVPLTDNEIDLLMRSIGLTLADDNDSRMENHAGWERSQRRKIARAIERHHGILPKEK